MTLRPPRPRRPHVHEFHGLWGHYGEFGPQDKHFHPCTDERCRVDLVGEGRDCGGPTTPHHRETRR